MELFKCQFTYHFLPRLVKEVGLKLWHCVCPNKFLRYLQKDKVTSEKNFISTYAEGFNSSEILSLKFGYTNKRIYKRDLSEGVCIFHM